jgi:hypothetical protein
MLILGLFACSLTYLLVQCPLMLMYSFMSQVQRRKPRQSLAGHQTSVVSSLLHLFQPLHQHPYTSHNNFPYKHQQTPPSDSIVWPHNTLIWTLRADPVLTWWIIQVVAWDLHTVDKHKLEAYDDSSQCLIDSSQCLIACLSSLVNSPTPAVLGGLLQAWRNSRISQCSSKKSYFLWAYHWSSVVRMYVFRSKSFLPSLA